MSNDSNQQPSVKTPTAQAQNAEVVKTGSAFDVVLWLIAISLLLGATLVNQHLPKYWIAASDIWVRVGVIVGCIVLAMGILYATHQGRGFTRLLKDSRVELRRVTWPSKNETLLTSWHVLLMVLISAVILWVFDYIFKLLMQFVIG